MKKANRLCGFCGDFTDAETINSEDGKTQITTCTKCKKQYTGIIMDKKTVAPDYLWDKIPKEER